MRGGTARQRASDCSVGRRVMVVETWALHVRVATRLAGFEAFRVGLGPCDVKMRALLSGVGQLRDESLVFGCTPLRVADLVGVRRAGVGVVVVDHHALNQTRASVLHGVWCEWLGRVGAFASLRFAEDPADALRWLLRHRGEETTGWKRCMACGGVPRHTTVPAARRIYEIGQFVVANELRRVPGRVLEQRGDAVTVEVFEGPAVPPATVRVSSAHLPPFALGPADCLWVDDDGEFQRVQLVSIGPESAAIHDGEGVRRVRADALRVRDTRPLPDPLAHLAAGYVGDLRSVLTRDRFLASYLSLASASEGLSGALSANVDLHAHQLRVVRQVLRDPVQRYLLADEVGLGKTIEAGLIVRQRLIDAPRSVVVCLVPGSLVPQWEDEFRDHLGLERLRCSAVAVRPYEEQRSWRQITTPDLVVIDEAHRIASGWASPLKEQKERFDAAKQLTSRAARVLLLSATPVLHRERDLLGMLHLLDPDNFDLGDIEGFTRRVHDRERLGSIFAALVPDAPSFLLEEPLKQLRAMHPEDGRLADLVAAVQRAETVDARHVAVTDVQVHVSETYRLHARMIRNRRSAIAGRGFTVRGRQGLQRITDQDPRERAVAEWLEHYRGLLLEQSADLSEDERDGYSEAYWAFVQAASGDLECLRHLVLYRRTRRSRHLRAAGIDLAARDAVKGIPLTEEAQRAFAGLLAVLGPEPEDDDRASARRRLAEACADAIAGERAVLFTSASDTAAALSESLEVDEGLAVGLIDIETPAAARRDRAEAFRRGDLHTLVCDASCEEGLNLQVADVVVHVDLPRVTTRIEQRIGRADRHGADGEPVRDVVMLRSAVEPLRAWLRVLDEVFEIFATSAASALFAVEELERHTRRSWFEHGVPDDDGLDVAALRTRLAEEQRRLDRVDALDALVRDESDDVQLIERIQSAEATQAQDFASTFLDAAQVAAAALDFTAEWKDGAMHTRLGRWSEVLGVGKSLVDARTVSAVTRGAQSAGEATGLIRPGDPVVEVVRAYLDWEDRAQTFAVWVPAPDDIGDLAIRATFVVAADPTPALELWRAVEQRRASSAAARTDADAPLAAAALQRRVDAVLAPRTITVWCDADGEPLRDVERDRLLDASLRHPRGEHRQGATSLIGAAAVAGLTSLARTFDAVRATAPTEALQRLWEADDVGVVVDNAKRAWLPRTRLLRRRAERSGSASALREADAEERLTEALLLAIAKPLVRWSSAGVLVLTESGSDRP